MDNINVKFKGIDFWSRPVFQVEDKELYIGSTETLFPDKKIAPNGTAEEITKYFEEHPEELVIFGNTFDEDDPLGTPIKKSINITFLRNG